MNRISLHEESLRSYECGNSARGVHEYSRSGDFNPIHTHVYLRADESRSVRCEQWRATTQFLGTNFDNCLSELGVCFDPATRRSNRKKYKTYEACAVASVFKWPWKRFYFSIHFVPNIHHSIGAAQSYALFRFQLHLRNLGRITSALLEICIQYG